LAKWQGFCLAKQFEQVLLLPLGNLKFQKLIPPYPDFSKYRFGLRKAKTLVYDTDGLDANFDPGYNVFSFLPWVVPGYKPLFD